MTDMPEATPYYTQARAAATAARAVPCDRFSFAAKLARFAWLFNDGQLRRYERDYPTVYKQKMAQGGLLVAIKPGPKYTKVDIEGSGRYIVVNETGDIVGIKGYGVPNWLHRYGTLDTVDAWEWSGYSAFQKGATA